MEMNRMIGIIIACTVNIIIFVSVLAPVIANATGTSSTLDSTWQTLITVCGTLTIIAILMMVVRALGNKSN